MADKGIKKAIVKIKVFGVGGGGNNVLRRIAQDTELDVELIGVNTDAKQLAVLEKAGIKTIQIGENITKGRGTGGHVEAGREAAEADKERLRAAMDGAQLVFVTATMGGGTGTGAAPVVAELAKEMGILSIGVVTTPFMFEGSRKRRTAEAGVVRMQSLMDALISVKNDNLLKLPGNRQLSMVDSFGASDDVLRSAIRCIAELILTSGVINVDFADLTYTLHQSPSSDALLGIGESNGSAIEAVERAVESPLIDKSLEGARGVIVNITGSEKLTFYEVSGAAQYIFENTHPDVNMILGVVLNDDLGDNVRVTIIATDFEDAEVLKSDDKEKKEPEKTPTHDNFELPPFMNGGAGAGFSIPTFGTPNDKK